MDSPASPISALAAGDPATIGPFTLTDRLGTGGMGVVYRGKDERGSLAAIKVMAAGLSDDVRERMRQEAQLLHRVDHPCIPRLLADDPAADPPWLAMTYVPGHALDRVALPLDDHALARLAVGLASALDALHAVGVVHRDVKPSNIILTDGFPALVDLGIAHSEDSAPLTRTGLVVGSPGWMAPEQLLDGAVGPWTDIWSWGAVLAYASTGRPPFGSGRVEALGWRTVHGRPDLTAVPDALRPLLAEALAPDPAARPRARDVLARLVDVFPSAPPAPPRSPVLPPPGVPPSSGVPAPPGVPARTAAPRRRTRRTAARVAAAVLVAGLGVLGLSAVLRSVAATSVRSTAPGSTLAAAAPWSDTGDRLQAQERRFGSLPLFPAHVAGYRRSRSWTRTVSLPTSGNWTVPAGFTGSATCDGGRVFLRWRDLSVGPAVEVAVLPPSMTSAAGSSVAAEASPALGTSGWGSAGGCGRPGFRLSAPATRGTIVWIEVEQWVPDPA